MNLSVELGEVRANRDRGKISNFREETLQRAEVNDLQLQNNNVSLRKNQCDSQYANVKFVGKFGNKSEFPAFNPQSNH